MQNEIEKTGAQNKIDGGHRTLAEEMDYDELFTSFILRRNIKVLRYMFTLPPNLFKFTPELYLRALELDAPDMAALLFKEFFRPLRDMSEQQSDHAITSIV